MGMETWGEEVAELVFECRVAEVRRNSADAER